MLFPVFTERILFFSIDVSPLFYFIYYNISPLCCISIVGISCHNIAFFTIAQQKKPVKHFSIVFSFVIAE
jgi:hypothetical protein